MKKRFIHYPAILSVIASIMAGCISQNGPIPTVLPTSLNSMGAFESGEYPNLFSDYLGKSDAEVQAKLDEAWNLLFYGDDANERIYYPVGSNMAYVLDVANDDVRSEGMSYGMMIAVQLNKKEEFDRIWKWTRTYMYQTEGGYKGYFAWHCKTDGTPLATNPASDGEEWFIMALMFADGRWGSGEGIYNYRAEAQSILDVALHADELAGDLSTNLFDPSTKQVVFVPQLGQNSQFTDPSYHLPHYYQLWSLWADKDNEFWAEAAQVSRAYLKTAVNEQTGLAPNYSEFDGKPVSDAYNGAFRFDAFRVGANVGVDYVWFHPDEWHVQQSNRLLDFFASQGMDSYPNQYEVDGTPLTSERSSGLIATNAVAALAADMEKGKPFVQAFWDQPVPTGQYRYYDGMLTMLALLQLSGNFRIYEPGMAPEGLTFPTPAPEINGKFTPSAGHALLVVGPDRGGADSYFDATVTAPGGLMLNTTLQLNEADDLDYLAKKFPKSILSVGIDLKGSLQEVVDGKADEKIDHFLLALAAYDRPILLRLGYGFDDPTHQYEPGAYISAWKHFNERIQANGSLNLALVWDSASLCEASPDGYSLSDWYPGDDIVDWIGIHYSDQFSVCEGRPIESEIQFAREHLKPVMITEATPRGYQIHDTNEIWNEWFVPFFKFVNDNSDVIRAISYINEGENNMQSNQELVKLWKKETKQAFWLRGGPDLFEALSK